VVSTEDSNDEIVAWYDNGTIYYYTEADKIYMNSDSSYMFNNMNSLRSIDVRDWDARRVTDMNSMFMFCNTLTELDVSEWIVSNVTDMSNMFA